MYNAGRPNAVITLDRLRLAVARNRGYAWRTGIEDDGASLIEVTPPQVLDVTD